MQCYSQPIRTKLAIFVTVLYPQYDAATYLFLMHHCIRECKKTSYTLLVLSQCSVPKFHMYPPNTVYSLSVIVLASSEMTSAGFCQKNPMSFLQTFQIRRFYPLNYRFIYLLSQFPGKVGASGLQTMFAGVLTCTNGCAIFRSIPRTSQSQQNSLYCTSEKSNI